MRVRRFAASLNLAAHLIATFSLVTAVSAFALAQKQAGSTSNNQPAKMEQAESSDATTEGLPFRIEVGEGISSSAAEVVRFAAIIHP